MSRPRCPLYTGVEEGIESGAVRDENRIGRFCWWTICRNGVLDDTSSIQVVRCDLRGEFFLVPEGHDFRFMLQYH